MYRPFAQTDREQGIVERVPDTHPEFSLFLLGLGLFLLQYHLLFESPISGRQGLAAPFSVWNIINRVWFLGHVPVSSIHFFATTEPLQFSRHGQTFEDVMLPKIRTSG